MAKGANQKLKMLYLVNIFMNKTDENHALSLAEITSLLNDYGVMADRKTLYQDFDELKHYGLDIVSESKGRSVVYHLVSREFELAELKLLVDSVQASRFITEKKSRELIKKLESLVSEHEAKELQRQVLITGRVKTMNESIFINVDNIHSAINNNHQISFQYFSWTPSKRQELRHNGQLYVISPWYLAWSGDNYYMIGYDSDEEKIKHFRVDKMLKISETDDKREGQNKLKKTDIASYSKQLFGMFGGDPENVTLECRSNMAGVIIDRFGKSTAMIKKDEEHFHAHVEVVPSDQFLGWVLGLGDGVRIISPESVVKKMKDLLDTQRKLYD